MINFFFTLCLCLPLLFPQSWPLVFFTSGYFYLFKNNNVNITLANELLYAAVIAFPLLYYIGETYSLFFCILGIISIILITFIIIFISHYLERTLTKKYTLSTPALIALCELIFVSMRVFQFYFYGLFITYGATMPFYCPFMLFTEIPFIIIPLRVISWPCYLFLFNYVLGLLFHYHGIIKIVFLLIFPLLLINTFLIKNINYYDFTCVSMTNKSIAEKMHMIAEACKKNNPLPAVFPENFITIDDFEIIKKIKTYSDKYKKNIILGCSLCNYSDSTNDTHYDNALLYFTPNRFVTVQKKNHSVRFFETKKWQSAHYTEAKMVYENIKICSEFFFHDYNKKNNNDESDIIYVLASWCWINKSYLMQYRHFMHLIGKFNSILLNKKVIICYGI